MVVGGGGGDGVVGAGVVCEAGVFGMDVVAAVGDEGWGCVVFGYGFDVGVCACVGVVVGVGGDELAGDGEEWEAYGVGVVGV